MVPLGLNGILLVADPDYACTVKCLENADKTRNQEGKTQ